MGAKAPFLMRRNMFELNESRKTTVKKIYDHAKNELGHVWRYVITVDDFYKDPDEVREIALNGTRKIDKKYTGNLIGSRVVENIEGFDENLKSVFEKACQFDFWNPEYDDTFWRDTKFMVNITNGDDIETRFNEKKHTYTFHKDSTNYKWAAVIYLNKDEECDGGTNFYAWMPEDPSAVPRLEYESEMKYNRMVLYECGHMHGAVLKRGMFTEFPRLVQVLFM